MRVFIATLLPPRPGGNRTIGQVYIDDYNNRMRDLAASEGAVLVDIYAALLPDVTRYIGVDGLHPNGSRLREDRRHVLPGHSEPTSKCDSLSGPSPRLRGTGAQWL